MKVALFQLCWQQFYIVFQPCKKIDIKFQPYKTINLIFSIFIVLFPANSTNQIPQTPPPSMQLI